MFISRSLALIVITLWLTPQNKCDPSTTKTKYLHVLSQIQSRFAITLITSEVVNLANASQEVFFTAQLPEAAFISNFSMKIDDSIIYGDVKEKEKAKKDYDEAVKVGKSAGIVAEKPRETNSFVISVNVAAGQTVIFNLTYQEMLKRTHGSYKHIINIQPQQAIDDLKVDVLINEQSEIVNIKIPKFGPKIGEKTNKDLISMTEQENCTMNAVSTPTSSYAYISFTPKQDVNQTQPGQLVVLYDVKSNEQGGHIEVMNGYFVHFFAPTGLAKGTKNVLFVLDKSGSMYGQKFKQTQVAMKTILKDLNEKDRFNILMFSDQIEMWKSESVQANQENIQKATQYVDDTYANGGTNIYDALTQALELLDRDERDALASMIIFLTDGEATVGETNSDIIVNNITSNNQAKKFVIHSLAFGTNADFPLVQRISSSNKGLARKIYEDSDADLQLTGFYAEISSPLLANVDIKYLNETVDVDSLVHDNSYNYYDGGEIVVVGKLIDTEAPNPLFTTEVSAKSQSGPVLYHADSSMISCPKEFIIIEGDIMIPCCIGSRCPPIPPYPIAPIPKAKPLLPASSVGGFIERMWAYQTIKKLLKSAELNSNEKDKLREKALQLSIKYKFVTELTSIVVVKPDQENGTAVGEEETIQSHDHLMPLSSSQVQYAPMSNAYHLKGAPGMMMPVSAMDYDYDQRVPMGRLSSLTTTTVVHPTISTCALQTLVYLNLNASSERVCNENYEYFVHLRNHLSATSAHSNMGLKIVTAQDTYDVHPVAFGAGEPLDADVVKAKEACANDSHIFTTNHRLSLNSDAIDVKNVVIISGHDQPGERTMELVIQLHRLTVEVFIVNLDGSGNSDDVWKSLASNTEHYFNNSASYTDLVNRFKC